MADTGGRAGSAPGLAGVRNCGWKPQNRMWPRIRSVLGPTPLYRMLNRPDPPRRSVVSLPCRYWDRFRRGQQGRAVEQIQHNYLALLAARNDRFEPWRDLCRTCRCRYAAEFLADGCSNTCLLTRTQIAKHYTSGSSNINEPQEELATRGRIGPET